MDVSLALGLAKAVDCPDPVEAAVALAHLVEDDAVPDLVDLPDLDHAARHVLVGVAVPVLGVCPRDDLLLCPILEDSVPVDLGHGPASNLDTSDISDTVL